VKKGDTGNHSEHWFLSGDQGRQYQGITERTGDQGIQGYAELTVQLETKVISEQCRWYDEQRKRRCTGSTGDQGIQVFMNPRRKTVYCDLQVLMVQQESGYFRNSSKLVTKGSR